MLTGICQNFFYKNAISWIDMKHILLLLVAIIPFNQIDGQIIFNKGDIKKKIETAKAAQARIIAEGERDKSGERVAQEKEQVKQLIAIETKLKQERTNKELAAIALETEKLKAQQKKVAADASAYENAKLVSAGLTPQERAEWDYKTSVGVAAEIAKIKFPTTMITSDEKGGTPLESLIGAAMAKQLTNGGN